jgi:hypothetical protein
MYPHRVNVPYAYSGRICSSSQLLVSAGVTALLAVTARNLICHPMVKRILDHAVGILLISLSLRLAFEKCAPKRPLLASKQTSPEAPVLLGRVRVRLAFQEINEDLSVDHLHLHPTL